MATVINTPATTSDTGSGMGVVVAAFVFILFLALLWFIGLPMMRSVGTGTAPSNGGTNIQVPDKVDLNVNQNPAK